MILITIIFDGEPSSVLCVSMPSLPGWRGRRGTVHPYPEEFARLLRRPLLPCMYGTTH